MERYRRKHPTLQDDGGNSSNGNGSKGIHNKSVLILDATATAFDIRYPTDLSLLNECRENTEKMIDELWEHTERKGHKTTYKPQKSACKIPESGKAAKNAQGGLRQAIGEQPGFAEQNLATPDKLLHQTGMGKLSSKQLKRPDVICEMHRFGLSSFQLTLNNAI